MEKSFHGIDLHKLYATITIRDSEDRETYFTAHCNNFRTYVQSLGEDDIVVVESINNAFFRADEIEKQGAKCGIVDPHKFRIIEI